MKLLVKYKERFRQAPISTVVLTSVVIYLIAAYFFKVLPDTISHFLEVAWLAGETTKEII